MKNLKVSSMERSVLNARELSSIIGGTDKPCGCACCDEEGSTKNLDASVASNKKETQGDSFGGGSFDWKH
ncbi:TIGR04149 family rSAM-modified RiPP [uncultured Alistipes sp.]|uniref:TIGR04149 family rSAM-modified RiPP n=1 Tax=uncultured Alistipes sp. TaxID=538949 RepID=UPI00345CDDC3